MWPTDPASLIARQEELAATEPPAWTPGTDEVRAGGCWVCFAHGLAGPGAAGDAAWVAATVLSGGRVVDRAVRRDVADAAYVPGLLALRVGRMMEDATRALTTTPEVLFVDATGRDHPRRAGLALHLGAVLDMPTVGVTHRPLLADGDWPEDRVGDTSALRIGDEVVASWVRTRAGVRPLVVHPGWRVDLATAVALVLATSSRRTPEPLRRARHAARLARAESR
jgi:deoxyribonuclease V